MTPFIQNTPTHLILGFLGSGKTTFLNACLQAFLADERWAILVNEAGKIGIDEALFDRHNALAVKQISGGCICCSSQLPLQIAIATLLKQHRPNRLWIEPTGLAHPKELLDELTARHWQTSLTLQSVITLINAHHWQQERYRNHDGYQQFVVYADVVVVNRFDKLDNEQKQQLNDWISTLNPHAKIYWQSGKTLDTTMIDEFCHHLNQKHRHHAPQKTYLGQLIFNNSSTPNTPITPNKPHATPLDDTPLPFRYQHSTGEHTIIGWQMPSSWMADSWEIAKVFISLPWVRIKGVVHTPDGWVSLNYTTDSHDSKSTDNHPDNRLEVIFETMDTLIFDKSAFDKLDKLVLGLFDKR